MSEQWFRVEVSDHKGQIVAIETEMLAGRDIGDYEIDVIRKAVEHLCSFVGIRSTYAVLEQAAQIAEQHQIAPSISDEQAKAIWLMIGVNRCSGITLDDVRDAYENPQKWLTPPVGEPK